MSMSTTTTTLLLVILVVFVGVVSTNAFPAPKPQYNGGAGVGRLVLDELAGKEGTWITHYDMILVERLQKRKSPKDVEEGALYVPDADLPRLHLCKILSVGPGREEENGMIAPDVNGLKPGDIVIAKNPWGIGPKDEELADGTKLSFMRSQDIAAKITGGLVEEKK
jgi:co-chaperonin GroES (HSP10)